MKSYNFLWEQQRLKKLFSPYKNRKNKTCFGKNCFGENLGSGENKDTQTKLKKKLSWGYTWKKIFSLSINANMTLYDP